MATNGRTASASLIGCIAKARPHAVSLRLRTDAAKDLRNVPSVLIATALAVADLRWRRRDAPELSKDLTNDRGSSTPGRSHEPSRGL